MPAIILPVRAFAMSHHNRDHAFRLRKSEHLSHCLWGDVRVQKIQKIHSPALTLMDLLQVAAIAC